MANPFLWTANTCTASAVTFWSLAGLAAALAIAACLLAVWLPALVREWRALRDDTRFVPMDRDPMAFDVAAERRKLDALTQMVAARKPH